MHSEYVTSAVALTPSICQEMPPSNTAKFVVFQIIIDRDYFIK